LPPFAGGFGFPLPALDHPRIHINGCDPETAANRYRQPLRTIAIRIRKKQQRLLGDASEVKYFAVRTNLWDWKPKRLLEWHREKAATLEAVHDVLKNELAAGVLPAAGRDSS
jgi:hypothetical protein